MAKRLTQLDAIDLMTIIDGGTNRVVTLPDSRIEKLCKRGLARRDGTAVAITPEGNEALMKWVGT